VIEHLYIHIPFCRRICTYCDFPKLVGDETLRKQYIEALLIEIRNAIDRLGNLKTIYIGGGTPSMLSLPELDALLAVLSPLSKQADFIEWTIEANPNDVTEEWARLIVASGVNRVSLGIQSGANVTLKRLQRTHAREDAVRAVGNLRQAGIQTLSGDFIYALPFQTIEELKADLSFALSLRLDHLSYYSLILEEKTLLERQVKRGEVSLPGEDLEADMAELLQTILEEAGYERYETSNYAINGRRSVHNLAYWQLKEYLGLGMAAHSQIGESRFKNHGRISDYLAAVERTGSGYCCDEDVDLKSEAVFLGLRVMEGVSLQEFEGRFQKNLFDAHPGLKKHLEDGLLVLEDGRLKTTNRGSMLLGVVERDLS
jgi:oxygen-independent coproporphyrinogen-3 oxidase